ncbi:aminoacyl-histidine dipeptidase [Filifactor alocis]|uniref:aminoacyl-histidine dipeptidase n=1 Tax=Filifactor alocis TaxID=143361 RepID=UPI0028E8A57B|nr:aminoacyl-histidine dipeptidase [Filifactor alocis]
MAIINFEPKRVFHYFEEISKIPRESHHEEKISNYLVEFAKKHDFSYTQDEFYNVIIHKPATSGYEDCATVMLQGHMDMVCEKEEDSTHNFDTDPIELHVDGDFIKANRTTLGADNGIAVAMTLAILDSHDIAHPNLEAVFTVQEETGLVGATHLDTSTLKAKYLINIDSEEEGELLTSCSGGVRTKVSLPTQWTFIDGDYIACEVSISDLKGGHSRSEIHRGRANAIILLGRMLHEISKTIPMEIFEISGGTKMNAIPRSSRAIVAINPSHHKKLKQEISKWHDIFKNELVNIEDDFNVNVTEPIEHNSPFVFSENTKNSTLELLSVMPNGVQSMSFIVEDLVESSLNLGVLTSSDQSITFESSIRSSVTTKKEMLLEKLIILSKKYGATLESSGDYPAWPPQLHSDLKDLFLETYKETFDTEMHAYALHAGVECGIFKEKMPSLDIVSFGPNMYDVHTPRERLSISSTERSYRLLMNILKNSKKLKK